MMAKGMCSKCYYRVKRGGTPELSIKQQKALRKCSIEGCSQPHLAANMCDMHYRRNQRHGDPNFINPKCNRDGNYKSRARKNSAQWKRDNPELNNAYNDSRKKRVRQATPSWVNMEDIVNIYLNRPKGHHVDHIIPLNGKDVCGLHVPWNLQYLPAVENLKKSNKKVA